MTIVLGDNQYGKAETHLVRVTRVGATHDIKDINVSIALAGDFDASHMAGDNRNVVPTDTQKNTVFAYAKDAPVGEIEDFALRLARHFVDDFVAVRRARVTVGEKPWGRVNAPGGPPPDAGHRAGAGERGVTGTVSGNRVSVGAALHDPLLLQP